MTGTKQTKKICFGLLGLSLVLATPSISLAGDTERRQAKRIHDRLTGIAPSATVLDTMEACILGDNVTCAAGGGNTSLGDGYIIAADLAMQNKNFYNVTLKNFAAPWTNEAQTVFTPLNDYTATVIGMVRDEIPFNQVLSANILYVGSGISGLPAYSMSNNSHYEFLENQDVDLGNPSNLVGFAQSDVTDLPPGATAGVLTSRAAARAFFIDGTNRAMFRFTMMNHLCTDLEPVKDNTRDAGRIQQDVTRSPGGDSRLFMNGCLACHAGMDPMNQAFSYYNYVYPAGDMDGGRIVFTDNVVQGKYLINPDNFKQGYITTDDSWVNYWRHGPNEFLDWDTNSIGLPESGSGAKSLGMELANSGAFAGCQVKKVFRSVCFRDPSVAELNSFSSTFKGADNYNMKMLFARTADQCKGN